MLKLDREKIEQLACDLMFNLSEEAKERIENNSQNFMYYLSLMDAIDVTDVSPLSYPFEDVFPTLREDVVNHTITQQVALENAPITEGDYIEVVQVISK